MRHDLLDEQGKGRQFLKFIPYRLSQFLTQQRTAARFRSAGKDLRVEFNNPAIGMFAQFNFCLYMAQYVERTQQRLHIDLTSNNYRDPEYGPNWFDYFLTHRHGSNTKPDKACVVLSDGSQLPKQNVVLTIQRAHEAFFTAFSLQPELVTKVDILAQHLNIGQHTLGVHFRATDKHYEANLIEASTAIGKIRVLLSNRDDIINIFVASDDARFPTLVEQQFPDFPVTYLEDSRRSSDDTPVHLGGLRAGNYAMGRDAMLNSLTLARCGALVRTTSFLSAWSSVFNPVVPVFMLNVPLPGKLWFPEVVIIPHATLL